MNSRGQRSVNASRARYEVVVIGAGQAGLALGHHLARQGRRFVILDRGEAVGSAWRNRWDSLTLFTSRRYNALPGLPFPGEPDGYPSRDEVVAYLERYAATFELPVEPRSAVRSLTHDDGGFTVELDDRRIEADQVAVATGPFQVPRVPAFVARLAPDVVQMHSVGYRNPDGVPEGTVLVVGGGNTGFQIAAELSRSREVHLAIGSRQTRLPQRILGRDLFWYLDKTGLIRKTTASRIGRRLQQKEDTLIGSSARGLRRLGVALHGRAVDAAGSTVTFADGGKLDVRSVIWATGFRSDYSWIDLPITGGEGRVKHHRGVTDVAGLYFLGLQWQWTRGSALLGFVKDDAMHLAACISEFAVPRAETQATAGQPATLTVQGD
jgi:putative flavoprotein involved in K+ transport